MSADRDSKILRNMSSDTSYKISAYNPQYVTYEPVDIELMNPNAPLQPKASSSPGAFVLIPIYDQMMHTDSDLKVELTSNNYRKALVLFILGFFLNITWPVSFMLTRKSSGRTRQIGNASCVMFTLFWIIAVMAVIGVTVGLSLGLSRSGDIPQEQLNF